MIYCYNSSIRLHGDVISCRRAFQRAVQTSVDDPEKIREAFLSFERIEGKSLIIFVFPIPWLAILKPLEKHTPF